MKTQGRSNVHIAVLDSDPAVLKYIQQILSDRFSVSIFARAAELTQSLRDGATPNLLLVDWDIAEDGTDETALSLVARLHAWKPSLKVIMLACSAELKEVSMATRMGAAEVILKPFRKSDIVNAVEWCLRYPGTLPVDEDTKEIPLNENASFVRASKVMR